MPCSDPTPKERDLRAVRVYNLIEALKVPLPPEIMRGIFLLKQSDGAYWELYAAQFLDELTNILCAFCKRKGDDFIYNGRDPLCRKLADWWDEHKESDRKIMENELRKTREPN